MKEMIEGLTEQERLDYDNTQRLPERFFEKIESIMPSTDYIDKALKNIKDKRYHDPVNHPKHYTSHLSGVECIQITRHHNFNVGNAIKYLWRADLKDAKLEDLKKAAWYINDEIKWLEMIGSK